MFLIAFLFTQLHYLKQFCKKLGCFLHDWNIHKWVTSTTKSLLNEILIDLQWMSLSMEVAMVTAKFCMEQTFITNCCTLIYK